MGRAASDDRVKAPEQWQRPARRVSVRPRRSRKSVHPAREAIGPPVVPGERDREQEARDIDRVVFFSDAVMAIAITLLVLKIELPELPADSSSAEIWAETRALLPNILTFAWSFLVVASFWSLHRQLFRQLDRIDSRLVFMNNLFLILIALLPFPSDTLGRFDLSAATVVPYALNVAAIGLVLGIMSLYADRLLVPFDGRGDRLLSHYAGLFYTTGVFLLSLVAVPINVRLVPWLWLLLLVRGPIIQSLRLVQRPTPSGR